VIKIPEGWSANVCIGGPKKDTLFVTASKGFLRGSAQGQRYAAGEMTMVRRAGAGRRCPV
jgi:sugar lactone lactonase YvrE